MAVSPCWRKVSSLGYLSRSVLYQTCKSRLSGRFGQQISWKSTESLLGKTTILLQDGLDIRELPLVVRRMGVAEFPFFAGTSLSSSERLRNVTEQDESFKLQLHACSSVKQVFRLLEVPGEQVTAYSAAFALQRLCQLQQNRSDDLGSFIRKAVFNELCDTATKEIAKLSTDTVISLVRCYLLSGNYPEAVVDRIDLEVERRLGDSVLSIVELCTLVNLLSENIKGDPDLLSNVWIHLGSRYKEIGLETITEVYRTLRNITPEQKYLLSILDKQLLTCLWQLKPDDIQVIIKTLMLLNHHSNYTLKAISKWLFLNIHTFDDAKLKDIVAAFTHFSFLDSNFMKAIERYISSAKSHADKTLLGLAMEYCRHNRYLSTPIFDAVAADFETNAKNYDVIQTLYALRPLGLLNYVPPNSAKLFGVIENVLWEKFTDFHPAHAIELLTSFIYIQRFPVNFIQRIFSPHFLGKVYDMKETNLRLNVGKMLFYMQVASKLELQFQRTGFVNRDRVHGVGGVSTILGGRWYKFHIKVGCMLEDILEGRIFQQAEIPRGTPHFIDFEICLNEHNQVVKDTGEKYKCRLAVLTVMPEHYCVNTKNLLGEFSMRRRHLRKLGYKVVEIYYEEMMQLPNGKKKEYIQDVLKTFIKL